MKDIIDVDGLPTAAGVPGWSGRVADAGRADRRRAAAAGGRDAGQDGGDPLCLDRPAADAEPLGPRPDAGRVVERLGGGGGGRDVPGGDRVADGRVDHAAGGLLRRRPGSSRPSGPGASRASSRWRRASTTRATWPGPSATWRCSPTSARRTPEGPPTIGRLRGPFEDRADPAMRDAFERALDAIAGAGSRVVEVALPDRFIEVCEASLHDHVGRGRRVPPVAPRGEPGAVPAADRRADRRRPGGAGGRLRGRPRLPRGPAGRDALAAGEGRGAGLPVGTGPGAGAGIDGRPGVQLALELPRGADGRPADRGVAGRPAAGDAARRLAGSRGRGRPLRRRPGCESAVRRAAGAEDLPPRGP